MQIGEYVQEAIENTIRDTLQRPKMLKSRLARHTDASKLKIIEGGDQSFKVPRSIGLSQETVFQEMVVMVCDWMRQLNSSPTAPEK